VILDWANVPGATGYMYQIGTSPNTGPEIEGLFSESLPLDLDQGTTYHWRVKTKNLCGQWGSYSESFTFETLDLSGIGDHRSITESKITTLQPNPSSGPVQIHYQIAQAGNVRLMIYDVAGRTVRILDQGSRGRGAFTALWDGTDRGGHSAGSGTYFVRLVTGSRRQEMRLLITR
jgi:hypothetical protein